MTNQYNPADWYWQVYTDNSTIDLSNGSNSVFSTVLANTVWSSARVEYVPTTDATFQSWLATGNTASPVKSEADIATTLNAAYPAGSPEAPHDPVITSFDFIGRFDPTELSAIHTASASNTTVWMWLLQTTASPTINLTNSIVISGVEALQTGGLIANAANILAY